MVLKNWQVSCYQLWACSVKTGQVSTARLSWTSCLPQLYPPSSSGSQSLFGVLPSKEPCVRPVPGQPLAYQILPAYPSPSNTSTFQPSGRIAHTPCPLRLLHCCPCPAAPLFTATPAPMAGQHALALARGGAPTGHRFRRLLPMNSAKGPQLYTSTR